MYWSQWDTAILVTGILTILLSALPVKSLKPRNRLTLAAVGAVLVVISVVLGNSASFTYPSSVEFAPVFPIAGAVALIVQHFRMTNRPVARAAPVVAAPAPPPTASSPLEPQPHAVVEVDPRIAAAANPSTALESLAAIAFEVPEARAAVAANPSAYPDLVDWLRQFDDPDIVSAIARRGETL